ncbi:lasso peptide biosynthesis B2 protein [Nonomuraea endophytica]|uniref:lasso peptide biosynthesis B2 protein n=1 Tax=Nonomuraea endophytica TaxID=714136 RepID=UPI0037C72701
MSEPQVMSVDHAAYSVRERVAARCVVRVARILAKRPPRQLRTVVAMLGRGARPATYDEVSRARSAVVNANWLCAGPKGCLPRSIATVLLCRLRGTVPTWCVGVRALPPFGAHAWVAAEGRDVDEPFPPGYHHILISVGPATKERTMP